MYFRTVNFRPPAALKAVLGLFFLAGLAGVFWLVKLVFAKSLLLGIVFVFFVLPVVFRFLFLFFMMVLPFLLLLFTRQAGKGQNGHDESVDVPFKVLE